MGFEVKTAYFHLYYEEGNYNMAYPENMGENAKKIIENILHSVNEQSMEYCTRENYRSMINNNFFFLHLEDSIVLFKTRPVHQDMFFFNEVEGIMFKKENIRTVWYLLDKIILFLFSEAFYDFYGSEALTEEFLEQYEVQNINEGGMNQEFMEMLENIRKTIKPFSFAYTGWNLEAENVKVYENGLRETMESEKRESIVDRILKEEGEGDHESMKLYYELPSLKRINRNENFFKESKKIIKQKKAGEVFWYVKKGDTSIPIPFLGSKSVVSFQEFENWLSG